MLIHGPSLEMLGKDCEAPSQRLLGGSRCVWGGGRGGEEGSQDTLASSGLQSLDWAAAFTLLVA